MNNFDRGIIKWQPFESLTPSKKIIQSLVLEKSKITKPILSEEELATIENTIIDAYYCKEIIEISYFKNGFIQKTTSKIQKIDHIYKMVYLTNNLKLLFSQIIQVELH